MKGKQLEMFGFQITFQNSIHQEVEHFSVKAGDETIGAKNPELARRNNYAIKQLSIASKVFDTHCNQSKMLKRIGPNFIYLVLQLFMKCYEEKVWPLETSKTIFTRKPMENQLVQTFIISPHHSIQARWKTIGTSGRIMKPSICRSRYRTRKKLESQNHRTALYRLMPKCKNLTARRRINDLIVLDLEKFSDCVWVNRLR